MDLHSNVGFHSSNPSDKRLAAKVRSVYCCVAFALSDLVYPPKFKFAANFE